MNMKMMTTMMMMMLKIMVIFKTIIIIIMVTIMPIIIMVQSDRHQHTSKCTMSSSYSGQVAWPKCCSLEEQRNRFKLMYINKYKKLRWFNRREEVVCRGTCGCSYSLLKPVVGAQPLVTVRAIMFHIQQLRDTERNQTASTNAAWKICTTTIRQTTRS